MTKKLTGSNAVNEPYARSGKYILRLYVTGILPNSIRAVVNIKAICEKYLKGRYELEIIDIYQQPELAHAEEIIAVPLLIKKFPLPQERMVGDLSNIEKVLKGLCIEELN
jgi:circadian clock protein KaiB